MFIIVYVINNFLFCICLIISGMEYFFYNIYLFLYELIVYVNWGFRNLYDFFCFTILYDFYFINKI